MTQSRGSGLRVLNSLTRPQVLFGGHSLQCHQQEGEGRQFPTLLGSHPTRRLQSIWVCCLKQKAPADSSCCGTRKPRLESGEGSRIGQESQNACHHLSHACTLVNLHRATVKLDESTRKVLLLTREDCLHADFFDYFLEQSASIASPCLTEGTHTHACTHTHIHTHIMPLKGCMTCEPIYHAGLFQTNHTSDFQLLLSTPT